MNNENLTAPPITNSERAARLGSIGGKVKSPAKKLAAKLRELRKKGLTKDTARELYELMTDPNMADLKILKYLDGLIESSVDVKERALALKLYMDWRRIRHGSKDKKEVNINLENKVVNVTFEVPKEFTDENNDSTNEEAVPSVEATV